MKDDPRFYVRLLQQYDFKNFLHEVKKEKENYTSGCDK
jgi:hypothetical protein